MLIQLVEFLKSYRLVSVMGSFLKKLNRELAKNEFVANKARFFEKRLNNVKNGFKFVRIFNFLFNQLNNASNEKLKTKLIRIKGTLVSL